MPVLCREQKHFSRVLIAYQMNGRDLSRITDTRFTRYIKQQKKIESGSYAMLPSVADAESTCPENRFKVYWQSINYAYWDSWMEHRCVPARRNEAAVRDLPKLFTKHIGRTRDTQCFALP